MFKGGFSKRGLARRDRNYIQRFVAETCRAEFSHWLPLLLSLQFFLWNPVYIAVWMPLYALLTQAPFIIVQRHVRPRLRRLLDSIA